MKPYNKAKIAYNWSSSFDIPMRFFEGMAMGCCVITNRLAHLDELGFIEGTHYLAFSNVQELVNLTQEVLKTGRWQEIAHAGYEAVKNFTYDNNLKKMLEIIAGQE